MSGLIFLAILFYAISYIAKRARLKEKPAVRRAPSAARRPQHSLSGPFGKARPTPPEAAPTARQRLPDPNPTLSSAPMTGPRPSSRRSPLRRLPPAA